jgi:hypothetical protein
LVEYVVDAQWPRAAEDRTIDQAEPGEGLLQSQLDSLSDEDAEALLLAELDAEK